jgi:hypothetical protein
MPGAAGTGASASGSKTAAIVKTSNPAAGNTRKPSCSPDYVHGFYSNTP